MGRFIAVFVFAFFVADDIAAQAPQCGSVLGISYKLVNAYSNGPETGTLASCQMPPIVIADPAGPQTFAGEDGYQYQCVELVRRFYREAVCSVKPCQVQPSQWNGKSIGYGNAQDFYPHAAAFGLISFANGAAVPPAPDDIIGFSTAAGDLGHVAIVRSIDTSSCVGASAQFTVQLLEQNTNRPHQLTGQCQLQVGGNYFYTLIPRSIPIQGWLREPLPPTPVTIDFEQFTGPRVFTGIQPPLTVGNATFYGGQLLTNETNSLVDESTVYGTASPYCPNCLPSISIVFAQRVSNVSFFLINGNTVAVTYTVRDDQGGLQTKTLSPNFLAGAGTVSLPDTNIQTVTVTSGAAPGGCCGWDFSIDNVTFTPVPIPGT